MGKACTVEITRDLLYQLYYTENLTVQQVARHIGCRTDRVITALDEYGFFKKSCNVTEEWLIEHFVTLHQTVEEIGSLLGCDESSVRYHLRKFGIAIKKRGKARIPQLNDATWLNEHYVTNQLSSCKIADLLGCAESSVNHALDRFDVPRRPQPVSVQKRGHYSRRNFSSRKRRLIMKRDEHQCQMPGCTSTSKLSVHHIIPVRERGTNVMENGVTLCDSCHFLTFGKEASYASLFQTIISTKSGATRLVSTPLQAPHDWSWLGVTHVQMTLGLSPNSE